GKLREAATPDRVEKTVPRFTHAKIIRLPGVVTFMGSVNFSHQAFDRNFEVGFFFNDTSPSWLEPITVSENLKFLLPPPEASTHELDDGSAPRISARYDWRDKALVVRVSSEDLQEFNIRVMGLVD